MTLTLQKTWLLSANIPFDSLLQMGFSFSYSLKCVKENVSHFPPMSSKISKVKTLV